MSSAQAERRLRLAHVAQVPPVTVVLGDDHDAATGDSLVLVRPGDALVPPARLGPRRLAVQLAVSGLAIRYLHRLLEQAAATGWELDAMAALASELERRCAYLIAVAGRLPLQPGLARSSRRRPRAALWHSGVWVYGAPANDLAEQLAAGARVRGDALFASSFGSTHRRSPRRLVATLAREGVAVREVGGRMPAGMNSPWVIEALAVPRLTAEHLGALRERFAAAPRCEWCALPVIGAGCRRCAAGALR
ncbi:MAG TPA: hypothetical protein VE824_05230 [Gaiellales bacterium]|nr:hypothetical protein [Gaiellales bacterium]